ncbi:dnaJ homolog subfamily C member 2-like [Hippocampus comes]|uniref:dnaJ homolog subfamily C member 2-like n=1 Tax=Hippocampus comes TaxID=109280 RepID=UPI00094ECAFE|nr:PREDICTED: dnaJ homolog subfamily C member 2-like [Hippocampus comes]
MLAACRSVFALLTGCRFILLYWPECKTKRNCVPATVDNTVPLDCFEAPGGDGTAAHWPPEEQKLLEEALKTHPVITPEHWDKKDCMQRYEEVVEKIEAKKAAQEQVASKSKN